MSNTAIWDALAVTDPAHTKGFKRAGGFSGTALKPIWIVKRLTEQFGPVGTGWGIGKPEFQVVPVANEVMVYCTVECWHTNPAHAFYGVGGDKVSAARQSGAFNDDEAFKKAFTDAVGNAFKFLGVGADIHMGQFDDSKYRDEAAAHFNPPAPAKQPAHSALKTAYRQFIHEGNGCGDGDEWSAFMATSESVKLVAEIREKLPHIWDGENWPEGQERPAEWEPLQDFINRRAKECALKTAEYLGN